MGGLSRKQRLEKLRNFQKNGFNRERRYWSQINKEFFINFPKTINENGCWIPKLKPHGRGYVSLEIEGKAYTLSRLVMCIFNDVKYDNKMIDTCHSSNCDRSCFNPDHLKQGTRADNINDSVIDKTHKNSRKENCPKCGNKYKSFIVRTGPSRNKIWRKCIFCPRFNK